MAPAAIDTIRQHFEDFHRRPQDYDLIITGDLGAVGREILLDLLAQKKIDIGSFHTDCGLEFFDNEVQGTGSGGSGCGCAAVTMCAHFLPMLRRGELKRILFVPTGALLSKISFNEGENIPGIAHAVVLEAIQKQIALLVDAENIIRDSGMENYKKTEFDSLEKQLTVLHEEVERYKDLKTL